jgi:hypothetical protein
MDSPPYTVIPALKNARSRLLSAWTIREYRLLAYYADGEFSANNLFTNSPLQMICRAAILGIEQYAAFRLSGIKKTAGVFDSLLFEVFRYE